MALSLTLAVTLAAQSPHPAYTALDESVKNLFTELESDKDLPNLDARISKVLNENIAFAAIAKSIMGSKVSARATPEQAERFLVSIRSALLGTYTNVIKTTNRKQLQILEVREEDILSETRVVVRSKVRLDSGGEVTINYDMRNEGTKWKIYNIKVLMGGGRKINLGRLFNRQFVQTLKANGGDIDKAINSFDQVGQKKDE